MNCWIAIKEGEGPRRNFDARFSHSYGKNVCFLGIALTSGFQPGSGGSGVFKGRQARHLPRAPLFGAPPLRCNACKFSLYLVKNLYSTHIMYYKADHKYTLLSKTPPTETNL